MGEQLRPPLSCRLLDLDAAGSGCAVDLRDEEVRTLGGGELRQLARDGLRVRAAHHGGVEVEADRA